MTLLALRCVFLILCVLGGWSISQMHEDWTQNQLLAVLISLAGGCAVIGLDKLLKGFSLRGLSAASFGLFIGFVMSYFIGNSVLFRFIDEQPKLIAQIVMYVVFSYLATVIALRGKDEFNMVIPYVKFRRIDRPERLVLLDTNIIIDGRIIEVCNTGFLDAVLIVPRFVLHELQLIADAGDDMKRHRGRRGLEVLQALEKHHRAEVKIHEDDVLDTPDVDDKLVKLAQRLPAEILTNDHNLQRIAELQKVKVLNLYELSKALRPVLLPGEPLNLRLVKAGKEPGQAVAYLADGTMVVVNHAQPLVGQEVSVVIESVLQTAAGRLVFAQLGGDATVAAAPVHRPVAAAPTPAGLAAVG